MAMRHFLIMRTFAPGALDSVNATVKKRVNEINRALGIKWLYSYANEDKTRMFCIYQGPSEAAVREAGKLNDFPVDSVVEVPLTIYAN